MVIQDVLDTLSCYLGSNYFVSEGIEGLIETKSSFVKRLKTKKPVAIVV